MTPEALLALSRSRASLTVGERFEARLSDARNMSAGRPMDGIGQGLPQVSHDLDGIVSAAFGGGNK